jgi:hypothetical protein
MDILELVITEVDNHNHTHKQSEHKETLNIKEF